MNPIQIFEKHPHWQQVQGVLKKLNANGYDALLAGGCVRDGLMGVQPKDFDVATSAHPQQVKKLFPTALEIGKAFGVMIIPIEGGQIEVTTFRSDGVYQDGRRPENVKFSNPKEDAERRDFTVNALFFDYFKNEVLDFVQGISDLQSRIIRAVGDPKIRFQEDRLRVLRAARFASQLEFEIEKETLEAMGIFKQDLNSVSRERITQEFKKISLTRNPTLAFKVLRTSGLIESIWPEMGRWSDSRWNQFLVALFSMSPVRSFVLMIALVRVIDLLQSEKIENPTIPFQLSKHEIRVLTYLINGIISLSKDLQESVLLFGEESGPLLSEFALVLTQTRIYSDLHLTKYLDKFLAAVDSRGELPKPLLNGHDFLRLGCKKDSSLNLIMKEFYLAQINKIFSDRDSAELWVRNKFNN